MSTDYTLQCTSSDGSKAIIKISNSIIPLPGSDTWEAGDSAQWDTNGGAVSSWGSGGAYLTGPYGPNSVYLTGFSKQTKVGDQSAGEKNYDDGTFPAGQFNWLCTAKA